MITIEKLGDEFHLGRLGNQLFQIASILGIGIKNNHKVVFPPWKYSKYFKNSIDYVSNIEFDHTITEDEYLKNNFIGEGNFNFHGFFQSEKYFKPYEDTIRFHFEPSVEVKNYLDRFDFEDTCSIHIRRGDYVGGRLHGHLTNKDCLNEYIMEGLKSIYSFDYRPKLKIFSDDIDWCKRNLDFENMDFVSGNIDIIDLFLMSRCENNIIANSSFSWWAAWLNENPNKRIVSPKPWLLGEEYPLINQNIIPETWTKINVKVNVN